MIITIPWLKDHLKTTAKESEVIDQLTKIGLEVEGVKENFENMTSNCGSCHKKFKNKK